MTLLDHFAENAGLETGFGQNGFARLPAHQFTDSLFLWATGDVTRTEVVNSWGLDATDEIQLDLLATEYSNKATKEDKNEYIAKIHASFRLYEIGKLPEARIKTILGL